MHKTLLATTFLAFGAMAGASAQTLNIAVGGAFTSMDPHYHTLTPNNALNKHVFDRLVGTDEDFRLRPGLAESWTSVSPTVWEFKLRQGVTWHDGSPFTAEDIVSTFERVPNVRNSPGSYTIYTRQVQRLEVVDPHTIRMHTASPNPLMPNWMSGIPIISKQFGTDIDTADFNNGRAAIGTGPYRLLSYTPGSDAMMERNPAWWGPAQPWARVSYRIIANDASRIAALRAGDVQVIDAVSTRDVDTLRNDANIRIASRAALRNIYLYLDHQRDDTPGVSGPNGERLERSPLRDNRVREALSISINRDAIVSRVMGGFASPSGQFLAEGVMGHDPSLKPATFDVPRAQQLLRDAGFPNGFRVLLAGPNNRYVNDAQIIQAVAQMWARIGVRADVQAMPSNVYFSRSARNEFPIGLSGWGTGTGEPDSPMVGLIATPNRDRGRGTSNRSLYSNPEFDALLERALTTIDVEQREELYRQATRIAMADHAIIPLHHQVNIWASRRNIQVLARNDEETYAMSMKPAE
ncbi:ABC transporter substrate-binding protein [Falsiroseomonas sp.]|uniref:ABC transporter substrate-binding protein n=1 Tax=Falsiroseomonas sp. TaxID=2870721 RepID=UPI00271793A9|nr:ABC transporter substrate-binding protein [Falsiroseomonas sp.]MDO9502858.1 ABC transporter substrate-binding protein [Falsiroseomonas sp.]